MNKFRVEIVSNKTGEVEAVIGKGLSERQAEIREMSGMSRINDDYHVRTVEDK